MPRLRFIVLVLLAGALLAADGAFTPTKLRDHPEVTSCVVAPDGHLYVTACARRGGSARSQLTRYRLDAEGLFTGTVDTLYTWSDADLKAMGLAVDPDATATAVVLWASVSGTQDGEWNGRIQRVTVPPPGQGSATLVDRLVDLPSGFHTINNIAFGPDRHLYICAGSTTTSGGIGRNGSTTEHPEKLLSAAILRADVRSLTAPLSVKTSGGGTYNPYASGAKVTLHGTAIRQPYDCVWHSNGRLYACTNQNDVNGNTGSCGGVPNLNDQRPREFLAIIQAGRTYGFPNAARGECVLMGGNPTSGSDPWEIAAYPVGTSRPSTFDPTLLYDISGIGGGSADGIIEYRAPGTLQGRLIVCMYGGSGNGRIRAFTLGSDGRVTAQTALRNSSNNEISIPDCLDLCEHPTRGHLYVAKYGSQNGNGTDGAIWLLRRVDALPSSPAIAASTTTLTSSSSAGSDAAAQSFTVWNSGGGTLAYTVSDSATWLSVAPTTGSSTGSAQAVAHTVTYDTDALAAGTYTATITVSATGLTSRTIAVTLTVGTAALRDPENPAGASNGLDYRYYEGSWSVLPAFATLTPKRSGTVATIDLSPRLVSDRFAFTFSGYLEAPVDGTYTLSTTSDDGSRLWIGDRLVVDNDGLHAARERSGTIGLKAGRHALLIGMFEATGGETLSVAWQGPGIAKQAIPAARLWRIGAANTPPVVDAGASRTLLASAFPLAIPLDGTVTDDGLPSGTLSTTWVVLEKPTGVTATFGDAATVDTVLTVSSFGTYRVQLSAHDGAVGGSAEATIIVDQQANAAPTVTVAAAPTRITLGQSTTLTATASDDGLPDPPRALTYAWARVGTGVGTVTFANAGSASTTATFSDASQYTLRCTVSDSSRTAYHEVVVTVDPPTSLPQALLVTHSTTPTTAEGALKRRLGDLGHQVTVRTASAVTAADAGGKAVVVVSSTITSTSLGTKLRTIPQPVVVWEPWVFDDFAMTGPTAETNYGFSAVTTQLTIADPGHPITAGLSGTITILGTAHGLAWGAPAAGARIAAHVPGGTRAAIFTYDQGATMVGLTAPGRRVAFLLDDDSANALTATGWALFDAAIEWAVTGGGPGGTGMVVPQP